MITIIDYGMGNLRSVEKAVERCNSGVRVSSSFKDIVASDKIILPGVGAFSKAIEELRKRGLVDAITESIKNQKPFLGICLGFQLLFSESEEGGSTEGLGVLKGRVKRFKNVNGLKIPHMGWNKIRMTHDAGRTTILGGVADGSYMYFVHSYYVEPEDRDIVLCETDYGAAFTSGIHKDNIYAFQFHPEKSQKSGLKIIENFVEL